MARHEQARVNVDLGAPHLECGDQNCDLRIVGHEVVPFCDDGLQLDRTL